MESMSYKTFVWPNNPHTYREEYSREPVFRTQEGVSYFQGMSGMGRIITGTGVFYGEYAFENFRHLATLFEESTPGNLRHPVWGIRYCYFTGLELTQEPRDNYISYQFTFTCANSNGEVEA